MLWGCARSLFPPGIARPALVEIVDQADPDSLYDSVLLTDPILRLRRTLGPEKARAADELGAAKPFDTAVEFALQLLSEGMSDAGAADGAVAKLSKREQELIDLLAEGLTDREIAEKLFISIRTVRTHLDRIREKTGARRRAELTRLALQRSR
jgi:DNA-binding CsgD family transcriptional regulator